MGSTAGTTYKAKIEGKLITGITASTTTGITYKIKQVNGATPTHPTAAHRLHIEQKTALVSKHEIFNVAAGTTQSGQTVTLGTVTRALPLSDGTDFTGSGTAQSFSAGADIFLTWDEHDAAMTPKLDIVNTMIGSGALRSSSTTTPVIRFNTVTTSQRNAISAGNGDVVYDSDLSQLFQYIGGAWTAIGNTGTAASTTTSLGTAEKGTTADIRAETATGDGGGPIFIPTDATAVLKDDRIVLKDATELTIASGAITVTQPYHSVDTQSDAASDDLDTITAAVGVGEVIVLVAAHTDRTVVIKHNTGNIKLADATDFSLDDTEKSITLLKQTNNWIEIARGRGASTSTNYVKFLNSDVASAAAPDSVSNTASLTAFSNTYSADANFLSQAGDSFSVLAFGSNRSKGSSAGTVDIGLYWGSTLIASASPTMVDNTDYQAWRLSLDVVCLSSGGSGKIYAVGDLYFSNSATTLYRLSVHDKRDNAGSITVNTTASAVLSIKVQFSAADTSNYIDLASLQVTKRSTTAS